MAKATVKKPSKRGILEGAPIGNSNATKSKRALTDALRRELAQKPKDLLAIVRRTIASAKAGEPWAQALVYERVDGKVPQAIVGDDDSPAIKIERVVREIIKAPDTTPKEG